MSRFTHSAAVLGWLGLSIQLYLVFYGRWSVSASQLGGLDRKSVV